MSDDGAQLSAIGRAILSGQIRHLLTIVGTAAIAHGIATQGEVSQAVPVATDYIAGALLVAGPMIWSALSKLPNRGRIACAVAALRGSPCPSTQPAPIATTTMESSMFKNFHIVFANDAQEAVIKKALADAGHVVEVAAHSAADDLVLALKASPVGTFIASEMATLKDASLTGAEKMEQVVAKAIPAAITLFAAGGVTATAEQVEDTVRGAAQLIYNQTLSTTVPALVADAGAIAEAVVAPPAAAAA